MAKHQAAKEESVDDAFCGLVRDLSHAEERFRDAKHALDRAEAGVRDARAGINAAQAAVDKHLADRRSAAGTDTDWGLSRRTRS